MAIQDHSPLDVLKSRSKHLSTKSGHQQDFQKHNSSQESVSSILAGFRLSTISVLSDDEYEDFDLDTDTEEGNPLSSVIKLSSLQSRKLSEPYSLFSNKNLSHASSTISSRTVSPQSTLFSPVTPKFPFKNMDVPFDFSDEPTYRTTRSASLPVCKTKYSDVPRLDHVILGLQYLAQGNPADAAYHWQISAYQNDAIGMVLYGVALRFGWGVHMNLSESQRWLSSVIPAATTSVIFKEMLTDSNFDIALPSGISSPPRIIAKVLCDLGIENLNMGRQETDDLALKCFELATGLGSVEAMNQAAGIWYQSGNGVNTIKAKASELYRGTSDNTQDSNWIYRKHILNH